MASFDPQVLARQTGGDAALEREVLAMFLSQATDDYSRLAAAGPSDAGDIAHRIKGAARAIGAEDVASAAARIEVAGTETIAMARLRSEIDTACREISRYLASGEE